jgi:hypothetical protein
LLQGVSAVRDAVTVRADCADISESNTMAFIETIYGTLARRTSREFDRRQFDFRPISAPVLVDLVAHARVTCW